MCVNGKTRRRVTIFLCVNVSDRGQVSGHGLPIQSRLNHIMESGRYCWPKGSVTDKSSKLICFVLFSKQYVFIFLFM
ncbi:hypothetical protein SB6422_05443 [Klebsiella huaxiensis]|uniref:Uncharacterized protein n=1 Tax=Klebsiella huaxiensis TaxID=2153354 RepID=A0A564JDL4_9ENTR|nr:hypothetical protein SB6422_05443 [Klebsiella huaxiensis]